MKKSRAYRATQVKNVDWEKVLRGREGQRCCVGMDVGKDEVLAVLRWEDGDFERPWRVANPQEVRMWSARLVELAKGRKLLAAMEPSGTYGDALRQALTDAGLVPHRVLTKASHDFAEVFDGVPSQHDGKDAAVVAELAAIGKSAPWPYEAASEPDQQLAYWVDWLEAHRREYVMWCGRVEGLVARHWPEALRRLKVRSATLLRALAHYGGPSPLAEDGDAAARLAQWGGAHLSREKIAALVREAGASQGVRQSELDRQRLRQYALKAITARGEMRKATRALRPLGRVHEAIAAQAPVVGVVTACVLYVHLGDPRHYHCGAAYRKAMGLNLKERSSGRFKGQLKISKRGPSEARRWLYLSALRLVREHPLAWYRKKKEKDQGHARGALVGVMRRLALALYQVSVSETKFEPRRLFPKKQRLPKRRGRACARR